VVIHTKRKAGYKKFLLPYSATTADKVSFPIVKHYLPTKIPLIKISALPQAEGKVIVCEKL
jgi:hypothetical protein